MKLFKISYIDFNLTDKGDPIKELYINGETKEEVTKKFLQNHQAASWSIKEIENNTPNITDRSFETGAVRDTDEGKESYIDSVSFLALKRYALFQKNACEKRGYSKDNWRKGIPIKVYEESLMRHLQKYLSNKYEGTNIEPDVDHLGAAFFNLQGIMHEEEKLKNK